MGDNYMNTIKNNIKELRTKKDIYQLKLAMDLGLTQETISSYERNVIVPSVEALIKMANYFNTSIDYILCRTKYDMPIDSVKPTNINEQQFQLLNKINKLSNADLLKAEAYIDGLNSK